VIPSGIYTDLGTKQLREMLFSETEITGLFCFENRKAIFEGVDSRFKFIILTFEKGSKTESFPTRFMRHDVAELTNFPTPDDIRLDIPLIRKLSPDSLGIIEFSNSLDVSIAAKTAKYPLLGEKIATTWNIALQSEFHMTNDSYLFYKEKKTDMMPLYEGKIIHQFTHQFDQPRYWLVEKEARSAVIGRSQDSGRKLDYQAYRLGFRKIARNTDIRTMIATIIPPNFHSESFQSVRTHDENGKRLIDNSTLLCLCGLWNSFVLDYLLRLRVTANVNFFYVYQLPVPRLQKGDKWFDAIVTRAAKLICTTPEFDELLEEVKREKGKGKSGEIFGVTNEIERGKLRAELDGIIAHIYGLTEIEFQYILTTFPIVPDPVKLNALNA
jgi:hypothetical protein